MSQEKFKQSRRPPVNPLDPNDDPATIMEKVNEMAKNMPNRDPITHQITEGNNQSQRSEDLPQPGKLPFTVEGNVPPDFAALFNKSSRAQTQKKTQQEQIPEAKPRLAYTNNPKLNDLLEGCKPTAQYEEVRLPSLSKFYNNGEAPEGGVIHIRTMTGQEEEILGTPRFLKKGVAINMIFKNCVQEKIQPDKWLTIDRTHLLIYLRGISYGPLYDVEIRCPACGHRFETSIDLDTLFVNFCPKDFSPDSLKGELPVTKYKFSYHLPTVQDENLINNYRERHQKDLSDTAVDDTFTWRTALLVEEIEGLNDHTSLMTLLANLPIADVAHLRNTLNDIPFGVDTKVGEWCPSCSQDFEVELPFETNFFFPQAKKASRTRVYR